MAERKVDGGGGGGGGGCKLVTAGPLFHSTDARQPCCIGG